MRKQLQKQLSQDLETLIGEFSGWLNLKAPEKAIKTMETVQSRLNAGVTDQDILALSHSVSQDLSALHSIAVILLQTDKEGKYTLRLVDIMTRLSESKDQLIQLLIQRNAKV